MIFWRRSQPLVLISAADHRRVAADCTRITPRDPRAGPVDPANDSRRRDTRERTKRGAGHLASGRWRFGEPRRSSRDSLPSVGGPASARAPGINRCRRDRVLPRRSACLRDQVRRAIWRTITAGLLAFAREETLGSSLALHEGALGAWASLAGARWISHERRRGRPALQAPRSGAMLARDLYTLPGGPYDAQTL